MYNLIDHCKSIELMMSAWYENSKSVLTHSGNLGFVREHFIKEVLSNFLPKSVIVGSGEIIDNRKTNSKQQDIIIYKANFPVISSFTNINTYIAEGVIATIEVKSNLSSGKPNLLSAFESAKQVHNFQKGGLFYDANEKQINPNIETIHSNEILKLQELTRIKTYVIGYTGWLEGAKFIENAKKTHLRVNDFPNLVYQPGMCMLRNDGFINPGNYDQNARFLFTEENCFAVFIHHLLKTIMINTGGSDLSISGYEAHLKYYLDPYFNFEPPIKFTQLIW